MENNLAVNIRKFRKDRGLTQEQLAEVFGVTVGAVHKWEAGLSTPELPFILEMADFFDTSLDVLIGFEARDNRVEALAERLRKMAYSMDPDGLSEAEKSLRKYPHNFSIVFECAFIYGVHGINPKNKKNLQRAIDLFELALTLISQNTDPDIDEAVIYGQLAILNQTLGDTGKALQIYKAHNAGGIFDIRIGQILAQKGDYKQADEYLSRAFVKQLGDRINLITGKLLCYFCTGEYEEARALIEAGLNENASYRKGDKPNILDKIGCVYLTAMAYVEFKTGDSRKASKTLKEAKRQAEAFDADPDYDVKSLRFIELKDSLMLSDSLGKTGMDSIEAAMKYLKAAELEKLWREVKEGK